MVRVRMTWHAITRFIASSPQRRVGMFCFYLRHFDITYVLNEQLSITHTRFTTEAGLFPMILGCWITPSLPAKMHRFGAVGHWTLESSEWNHTVHAITGLKSRRHFAVVYLQHCQPEKASFNKKLKNITLLSSRKMLTISYRLHERTTHANGKLL